MSQMMIAQYTWLLNKFGRCYWLKLKAELPKHSITAAVFSSYIVFCISLQADVIVLFYMNSLQWAFLFRIPGAHSFRFFLFWDENPWKECKDMPFFSTSRNLLLFGSWVTQAAALLLTSLPGIGVCAQHILQESKTNIFCNYIAQH